MSITKTREFFSLPNVHYAKKHEKGKTIKWCLSIYNCLILAAVYVILPIDK